MINVQFRGSGVALVTPFTDTGVDYDALGRLIDFQLEKGTDALLPCGTTGEPSTMSDEEKEAVIAFTVERAAGRVPVIAGTGSNDTMKTIQAAKRAKALGADGQLCVTPYYNKTTQHGLIAHYRAIADGTELPVFLYNVPPRTGMNMTPETLGILAEHENIVAMKEASGDINQVMEMVRAAHGNIAFYSGADEILYPLLSLGFHGVISVAANIIPDKMHSLAMSFHEGRLAEGLSQQFAMSPLVSALFCEINPVPVKTALKHMGIGTGHVRMPLYPMLPANEERLVAEMAAYGILDSLC